MSTSDIIGICERLENDIDYKQFCEYLIESFKDTTYELMKESLPGASKITAEDFARAKVYDTLAELPTKIKLALSDAKPKKTSDEVYHQ